MAMMSAKNSGQLPWRGRMRQLKVAEKTEWMAPDDVVEQVRTQYLDAANWLTDTATASWAQQWAQAPAHLSGSFLKRHRNLILTSRQQTRIQLAGVLRADHQVEVRQFSEAGSFCLVIDTQTQRRMATYNRKTHERLHTQDMGEGAVVYAMRYDATAERWKIDSFVQELPIGWRSSGLIEEFTALPSSLKKTGRDY